MFVQNASCSEKPKYIKFQLKPKASEALTTACCYKNFTKPNKSFITSFKGFYLRKDIVDYTIHGQSRLSLGTRIFREPFLWKALPEYLEKRFGNQNIVKILQGACSVGLETRAIESELAEQLGVKRSSKYNIIASDPDSSSVSLAKTNLMCFSSKDKDIHWHKDAGISDFSKYFEKLEGQDKAKNMEFYYKLMKEGKVRNIEFDEKNHTIVQTEPSNHGKSISKRVIDTIYKVPEELTKNTTYKVGYIQDILKEQDKNNPFVVFLRNAACCLNKKDRIALVENIYREMPAGSSLIIGDADLTMYRKYPWSNELINAGFTRLSSKEKTAGYYIFEKN